MEEFRLHPLIHTFPSKASVLDVEKKNAEPKTPHILNLNQDAVAWSQTEKCRLKYLIYSLRSSGIDCMAMMKQRF